MKLENRISLVTGGSRGIGKATALRFASEGSKIILNYKSNDEEAEATCNEIKKFKVECLKAKYDVSKSTDANTLVKKSLEHFGRVDILFNNAGLMITNTFSVDDFDQMIKTNVSSVAGIVTALEGTTYYSITKGAVITLTRRYAFELGKYGVNVNGIAPGYIETDLTRKGKSDEEWNKIIESISKKTILGRIGKPDDIARVALFLASNDSDFITGQVIVADGGRIDYITHSL